MVTAPASRLVCSGCGASPSPTEPYPFRCPNAMLDGEAEGGGERGGGSDVDHVLVRVLDRTRVRFPDKGCRDDQPFVRYRGLLHSYHRALAAGVPDAEFVALVTRLDRAIEAVDGRAFRVTPFARDAELSDAFGFAPAGGVWIKDETGNVAGSHKARHLMGVLLHLEIAERLGLAGTGRGAGADARPDLAIASCGNAALAAAVVAAAGGRTLRVFVPSGADPAIVDRLEALGAGVVRCPRDPDVAGDPAYARMRDALRRGALPFTCQGNENGLVIEGGETLGYEMVSTLADEGIALDHVVVQVGGGALASACVQALSEAVELGALGRLPRIHTVQTASAHPLERAYRRVRDLLPSEPTCAEIDTAIGDAAHRRSAFMWPWEHEGRSMASGILDDETYDWLAVVRGMLRSDGRPVVVSERTLADAHLLGHRAGYAVSPTGSSGLAGLIDLVVSGAVAPDDRVAVLFTGVDREP